MFGNDLPKSISVGVRRYTFEHERCCANRKGAVYDIGVAGYPANIGSAPISFTLSIVEYGFHRQGCLQ